MSEVTISCPHCRRQYTMKIDPERLQRLKTRATCGRCGKTFDAASRIIAAQQQQHAPIAPAADAKPKPPRTDVPPPAAAQLKPTLRNSGVTSPDLRDEMEELAREFAEAAARFTPVGIKRSSVGLGNAPTTNLSLDTAPQPKLAAAEDSTNPGITPASVQAAAAAAVAAAAAASDAVASAHDTNPSLQMPPMDPDRSDGIIDAGVDQFSLDAEPAGEEEEFAAAVPTLSRGAPVPRSWLDQSDPGLASLQSPPSAGATALEALLNESETIALPPPPTAS